MIKEKIVLENIVYDNKTKELLIMFNKITKENSFVLTKRKKKIEDFNLNLKNNSIILYNVKISDNINIEIFEENNSITKINLNKKIKNNGYNKDENAKVIVEEISVSGINNPYLELKAYSIEKNQKLILKIDNNVIEFDDYTQKETIDIRAKLPKKTKYIEVITKVNKKEYTIIKLKTSKIKRLKNKLYFYLMKIKAKVNKFTYLTKKGIVFLWKEHKFIVPPTLWGKYFDRLKFLINANTNFYDPMNKADYNKWLEQVEENKISEKLKYTPLISVVIPVYNVNSILLKECIDSVLNQSYQNFEICIADDNSTNIDTINTLKEYENQDKRIKVIYRKENGHISKASNSALELVSGEYIALMDNDDILTTDAFYEVVKVLNTNPKIDFIYSDEDKLDIDGKRCEPHFKPDYSPDTLLSLNYISHLTVIRTKLIQEVEGWEVGLEGAQDYDLYLKVLEKTNQIHHIPKILYHWRKVEGSTSMTIASKSYALDKGKIAIENALKRRKIDAIVEKDETTTYYKIKYILKKQPKISIIIPTRDYAETLETCLKSLYKKTIYKNFEIIIMNNQSAEKETYNLFDKYKNKHKNFKVIDVNTEFNYSNINNIGVENSSGEYILLLNNDTEIIHDDWLEIMVGYASQPHIGAVGAKLLYPDTTVQHAGVIIGLGGVASHVYIGASTEDNGLYGRLKVPYNYSAVTAACLMVSKEKFKQVNGLEEELKVAYNDIDLNLKLREKGYYNICLPQVLLTHFESKSRGLDTTSEKYKRFLLESEYMENKWKISTNKDPFYNDNYTKKAWYLLEKGGKKNGGITK